MERNPWTSESIGERSRVRGTERTEDRATVWEMTASADTGHSSNTGHLYFMVATRVVAARAARTLRRGLWRVRRLLRRHRRLLEASRRSPVVRDIVTQLLLLLSSPH